MNPELKAAIRTLREASRKGGAAIWAALADELDKAKRRRTAVNLSRINRHSEAGDIVAVPGKVLAAGSLTHPVTVAAFSFSDTARRKIALAEGRALTLTQLLAEGVEPSRIKIVK
ncbi:MAG: 50S ribosomal protein L18e [Candidatus Bathyarchaeia archaeon]